MIVRSNLHLHGSSAALPCKSSASCASSTPQHGRMQKWTPGICCCHSHLRVGDGAGLVAVHERRNGQAQLALTVSEEEELILQPPDPLPVQVDWQSQVADVCSLQRDLQRQAVASSQSMPTQGQHETVQFWWAVRRSVLHAALAQHCSHAAMRMWDKHAQGKITEHASSGQARR